MTEREPYLRGPGPTRLRYPSPTKRRPPVKDCPDCGGTGWIEHVETRLPEHRCHCTTSEETTD